MRWKRKTKRQPKEGDTRIADRFLLFPKCLDDEWRWLELTQIQQEYRRTDRGSDLDDWTYQWVDLRWATLDEFLEA